MRWMKTRWLAAVLPVTLLLVLAIAWPAYSQVLSLQQLLSGQGVPNTIEAKELTSDYRVLRAGENANVSMMQMLMFGTQNVGLGRGVYYTKGETIKVGDITYVIGYTAAPEVQPTRRPRRNRNSNVNPFEPRKLGASEKLTLSLLNLSASGSLSDIRSFDPKSEILSDAVIKDQKLQAEHQAANDASVQNLRQLGLAVMQYVQDYDECFPPMVPATSFQQIENGMRGGTTKATPVHVRLQPYLRNTELLRHPVTKEIYRPNMALSGKNLSSIENVAQVAMFYEGSAAPDGKRAVAFVDGHVMRVHAAEWERIKKVSGMVPAPKKKISKPAPSGKGKMKRLGRESGATDNASRRADVKPFERGSPRFVRA